jgi:ribonuclease E
MLDTENPGENNRENRDTTADTTGEGLAQNAGEDAGENAAQTVAPAKKAAARKTAAKKTAQKAPAKKAATKKAATTTPADGAAAEPVQTSTTQSDVGGAAPAKKAAAKRTTAKKTAAKATAKKTTAKKTTEAGSGDAATAAEAAGAAEATSGPLAPAMLFQAPDPTKTPPRTRKAAPARKATASTDASADADASGQPSARKPARSPKAAVDAKADPSGQDSSEARGTNASQGADQAERDSDGDGDGDQGGGRRRRRRGGRRRRKGEGGDDSGDGESSASSDDSARDSGGSSTGGSPGDSAGDAQGADDHDSGSDGGDGSATSHRRRRRRRTGEDGDGSSDDPQNTVTRVRKPRSAEDEITSVAGSTRLEAKKQRRREGREAGRRRAPIVSEAEFLARREAVDRVMVIRQRKDLTQIAVLEDKVLVEHYVARDSQTSLIGNVYLGRVQNVLPSMEAAFIDIGKGRNAVLYAGEVNWDSFGAKNGGQRKIEQVLKSGQSVLVQVTKDPIGHKGARLTSQISLPGRFLVYVPDGTTSGISRKLPDTERSRLKTLLKEIVPDTAGVIVRTAAEGASEDELTRDVERLTARWEDIEGQVKGGNAPQLLYGEPDLTLKVVRDLFTEDFAKLVVSGGEAWDMVDDYVEHVAPDLAERLEKYAGDQDVFAAYRIDEQIAKGLDRKVWLPSGGSLIVDRTEAMTVVDVNTGKFTGSGGNLEETVTKNNLEAAEEMVRQLRLRDIGGIIVVDFIDMVLESNRDLVLRRLVECLGRDRTRHQVAEVTSLGLVQMTRKRIGTGLLEAFSETCEHCQGRGLIVHHEPVEPNKKKQEDEPRRGRRGRGRDTSDTGNGNGNGQSGTPSPKDVAAMARADTRHDPAPEPEVSSESGSDAAPADDKDVKVADASAVSPASQETEPQIATDQVRDSGEDIAGQTPAADEPQTSDETETPDSSAGPAEPVVVEPAAPRIVTTVRRRGARRAAGPPTGSQVQAVGASDVPASTSVTSAPMIGGNGSQPDSALATEADAPAEAGAVLTVDGTEEVAHSSTAAHVPIKKKGSRKH